MGYEIKGTIHTVGQTKVVSDKFSKREFVVSVKDGKYEQLIEMQATGDRIGQLDALNFGDSVHVEFNIRGREWRNPSGGVKYFTTLEAWRIKKTGAATTSPAQSRAATTSQPSIGGHGAAPDDDIPFASCDVTREPSPIAKVLR